MKTYRLVFIGFGNVGKAFVRLFHRKQDELANRYGLEFVITGIATRQHGYAMDPDGIPSTRILGVSETNGVLFITRHGDTPAEHLRFH